MASSIPDSAAVTTFKANVKATQAYLQEQGYDIKISHLLEALSRYEHQKNWQTQRGLLSKNNNPPACQPGTLAKLGYFASSIPDLKGKAIEARVAGFSTNEEDWLEGNIVWNIDQAWVVHLLDMAALAKEKNITVTEGADLAFEGFEQAGFSFEEIAIYPDSFILKAETDHGYTKINSPIIDLVPFMVQLAAAVDVGEFVYIDSVKVKPSM